LFETAWRNEKLLTNKNGGESMKKTLKIKRNSFKVFATTSLAIFALTFGAWLNFAPRNENPASALSGNGDVYGAFWTQSGSVRDHQTLYAYLAAGDKLDVSTVRKIIGFAAQGIHVRVYAPDGSTAYSCEIPANSPTGTTCAQNDIGTQTGIYKFEMSALIPPTTNTDIFFGWSAVVKDSADTPLAGRIWTNELIINQMNSLMPIQLDTHLYAINDMGYIYDLNLIGFAGAGSVLSLNAAGLVNPADSCISAYESATDRQIEKDLGVPQWNLGGDECVKFRLFFDEPAADLPTKAQSADGEMNVKPVLLDPGSTLINNFSFVPSKTIYQSGSFIMMNVAPEFSGNFTVQIDVNNNGSYDDAVDRDFPVAAPGGDENADLEFEFDGRDGNGNLISAKQAMTARIKFDKFAETHVVFDDVESLGGFSLTALNGANAGNSTVYWNDTKLILDKPNWGPDTPQPDGRAGVVSDVAGGVHGWGNGTTASVPVQFGDMRKIDNWTYIATDNVSNLRAEIPARFTVTFEENGGSPVDDQGVLPNEPADEPSEPTRERSSFECWYLTADFSGDCYDFDAPVTTNITLYAKWVEDAKCESDNSIYADDENCVVPEKPIKPVVPIAPDTGYRGNR
jgi:hypothetical protein